MKRFLLAIVPVFLFAMFVTIGTSAQAKDDLTGHYSETDMRALIEIGVLEGYEPGVYKPEKPITRAEFAKLIIQALELDTTETAQAPTGDLIEPFTDVLETDWFYSDVYAAVRAGIVRGYPNNIFKPNKEISREEMAVMVDRALAAHGIISEIGEEMYFTDSKKIGKDFKEAVNRLTSLGIMTGNPDRSFAPQLDTVRGQAGIVLNRTLVIISGDVITPPSKYEYKVAQLNADWEPTILNEYETFAQAKKAVKINEVVLQEKINASGHVFYHDLYIKGGTAAANGFTIIYHDTGLKSSRSYVPSGTEFNYLDATEKYIKIEHANVVGYVSPANVKLIPTALKKGQSYYENKTGDLYHSVYNPLTDRYAQIHAGKAPSFMAAGQKYYSWDGIHFTTANGKAAGTAYQYFKYLPLHTTSNYTAADIDRFLTEQYPDNRKAKIAESPLAGIGEALKRLEKQYEVNALYLMANAIHESDWGTSKIAQDKNNLFGIDANDSNPYENARTFKSFADCLEFMAKQLVAGEYHNPANWKYNGAILGNKAYGMNVRYASDPDWGEKIAGHMYRADKFLGSKDFNAYTLALTNVENLNVRPGYGTESGDSLLRFPAKGTPIVYTEKKAHKGATWYEIRTDDRNNRIGYVYGDGSLGKYIIEMPIMK